MKKDLNPALMRPLCAELEMSREGSVARAAHGRSLLNGFAALGEVGSWGAPVMVGRPSGEGRGVEAARCLGSSRCCC